VLGAAVSASPLTSGLIDDEVLAAKSPTAEEPEVPDPAVELLPPDPAAVVLEAWREAVVAVVDVSCNADVVAVVDVSCAAVVAVVDVSCAAVVDVSRAAVVDVSCAAVVDVSCAAVVDVSCAEVVDASTEDEVVVDHACAGEPPEASSTPSGPITANAPATNTGVSLERTIPPRHTGQSGARFALAPRQASDASSP
jgi:hypothetical protein